MRSSLFLLSMGLALTEAAIPPQLFSSLVPAKVLDTADSLPLPIQYPQYTDMTLGQWQLFSPNTWTSGFFPVTLYALNTRETLCGTSKSNNLAIADWLNLGRSTSSGLIPLETNNSLGHDVGFISFAFVEELVINPQNQTAITAVNNFAKDLAARFNPIVGCTRSWDTADPTDFQVIIDNMMNLEVLFVSAHLTGNQTLRDIATSHADTTLKNHIRPDGGTWHVVEYNATTGAVVAKFTSQGYANSSTWSRGQSWGVYGYANMFKRTGNATYLNTSIKLANYFLDNLPSNGIVPWDFNAPPAGRPADSSAAMIVANGLLLLGQLDTEMTRRSTWISAATQIISNMTALAWDPAWQSLLANGTVNKPANNYLTGTAYGDYYFVRAGNELIQMGLAECT